VGNGSLLDGCRLLKANRLQVALQAGIELKVIKLHKTPVVRLKFCRSERPRAHIGSGEIKRRLSHETRRQKHSGFISSLNNKRNYISNLMTRQIHYLRFPQRQREPVFFLSSNFATILYFGKLLL
jgi:hypothetical protein